MLLDPQVNAYALTRALDAHKARTSHNVSVGKGSSLVRGVDLRRSLSNPSAPLRMLITRSQRKTQSPTTGPVSPSRRDQRGPVATKALKSQTRLSYPQRQKLVDAYVSGMPVKRIAELFGVHRTTIIRIVASTGAALRDRVMPSDRSAPLTWT